MPNLSFKGSQSNTDLSCWERCWVHMYIFMLQFSNFIDFLIGVFLLFCGVRSYESIPSGTNNAIANALPYLLVSLGTILLFQVFLTSCAFTTPGCRCLVTPSAYLSVIIAIFAFVMFLSVFLDKNSLFNYLNEHGTTELNLTTTDIETIEANYINILYILLVITLIQFTRFHLSLSIQKHLYQFDSQSHTHSQQQHHYQPLPQNSNNSPSTSIEPSSSSATNTQNINENNKNSHNNNHNNNTSSSYQNSQNIQNDIEVATTPYTNHDINSKPVNIVKSNHHTNIGVPLFGLTSNTNKLKENEDLN